jgi:hypothetical protein
MSTAVESQTWVDSSSAARAVGASRSAIRRWGAAGLVSVRRLPFCRPKYRLADVERLARESTREIDCRDRPSAPTGACP